PLRHAAAQATDVTDNYVPPHTLNLNLTQLSNNVFHPTLPHHNSTLDLTRKTALILGGTQGIGKAIAARLAALGTSISIAGRNEAAGAAVIAELETVSPPATKARFAFHKVDVSLMSEIRSKVSRFGGFELKTSYSVINAVFRDSAYNDLATKVFTSRYAADGIAFHYLYPGQVTTNALNNLPWYLRYPVQAIVSFSVKPEDYADVPIYAATAPEFSVSGRLLNQRLEDVKSTEFLNDPQNGKRLWKYSVERAGLA
ncbi:hypothetical protein BC938DRAFT_472047, partial [Jimgerdemannia flammicorona]